MSSGGASKARHIGQPSADPPHMPQSELLARDSKMSPRALRVLEHATAVIVGALVTRTGATVKALTAELAKMAIKTMVRMVSSAAQGTQGVGERRVLGAAAG